jgi:hypothetical protein
MLSEKYNIKDFVEAIKAKNFEDVGHATTAENTELQTSEDPFLSKDYLKHMTIVEQKKFIDQRNVVKADYGKFLQHLRTLVKDEKTIALFNKNELGYLDTIFRNIAIVENPRCARYINALKGEMEKQAKSASR